jgi:hypothetical protein
MKTLQKTLQRSRNNNDHRLTIDVEPAAQAPPQADLVDDHVFLLGRPPLKQYVDFVTDLAVNGDAAGERTLSEEWHAAQAHIEKLSKREAGWPDAPHIEPLGEHLDGLRDAVFADPLFKHAFGGAHAELGIVELDRLVVYQKHINLEFVKQLKARLGPDPSEEELFRVCLPYDHPKPPIKWMRTQGGTFTFVSPSNDLRFLGPVFLKAENLCDVEPPGNLAGVIGLAVGFGSNYLFAIQTENRLVLTNGSHRAYTLRDLGLTHAPCVIQKLSSREEIRLHGSGDFRRNPDLYLKQPRPSVLKDYFNPRLRKIVPVPRRLRQVRVKYTVDESDLPAI